eukprot:TRINITY_DN5182_c0_g1_i1.p1 TRINITY_DN5182_c0_g1~~TRINITY_DN5182_c0_g1_i1.p1  ORF type:complete len:368 (+),score=90.77 TRINITY_DN5182_c0_g1_i1:69-1172(+)
MGGEARGFVAPGYESVKIVLEQQLARDVQVGAQVIALRDGKPILDLCAGKHTEQQGEYVSGTLQQVYSSGKMAEVFAIAWLYDRGFIQYEDKVTKYWPEFGANGKGIVTIAGVMQHRGGFPKPGWEWNWDDVDDVEALEARFAAAVPTQDVTDETRTGYNGLCRGFLVNALVRRIDPQRRQLHQLIQDEFCTPLGLEWFVGLPPSHDERVSPVIGRAALLDIIKPFDPKLDLVVFMQTEQAKRVRCSSTCTITNAAALVAMAEIFRVGVYADHCLLQPQTIALVRQHDKPRFDTVLQKEATFTYGGLMHVDRYEGALGFGGSTAVFDAATRVTMSMCMNLLMLDGRGVELMNAVVAAARQLDAAETA